jgi:pyridoxal phosphate enzyme (YggS family)
MLIGPQKLLSVLGDLHARIDRAASAAGRNSAEVTLIAVSKTQSAQSVRDAATAGVTDFGENYLQEALAKIEALDDPRLTWHFIGGVQSNKTRPLAERFAWVHGVDRLALARRLSDQRPFHAPPLNLCIQVALVPEPAKRGVTAAELLEIAPQIAALPRIRLRGLMCVPPPSDEVQVQRARFSELRRLRDALNARGLALDTLSMGMSGDFEAAIAEGATMVRIGTALFGPRATDAGTRA